jgi:hypothetical protein
MKKSKFSLTLKDKTTFLELIKNYDKKTLAIWAIDCTERVLPYFEKQFPKTTGQKTLSKHSNHG